MGKDADGVLRQGGCIESEAGLSCVTSRTCHLRSATNRQQDNQGNRRCFHTRAPRPQGTPGGRIITLECVADAFAVWRPSSLHDTLTGGRPPEGKFPTPIGGLTIISGNNGWRNC